MLTGDHDPYAWPESAHAALLAGLAATREADQKDREKRLLGGAK